MLTALSGCPSTQRTYQTLGDLYLISDLDTEQECKEFVRELDLESHMQSFLLQGDVRYEREVFVSKPEDCMVIRFAADAAGMISLRARLERDRFLDGVRRLSQDTVFLYGVWEKAAHTLQQF